MAAENPTIYTSEKPEVCHMESHPSGPAGGPVGPDHIFRLIELLPGVGSHYLEVNLFTHKLADAPKSEAISYVWGKTMSHDTLLCNGIATRMTVNLEAALRRIRLEHESRWIWVDAICINQGNKKEKSHHVSFMNKIYAKATQVLACMGKDPDGGAGNVKDLITEHKARVDDQINIAQMPELATSDAVFEDTRWKSMAELMHCEWFTRAWVLQEVGVAKDPRVLYGSVEFTYRDLMKLARWIVQCASSLQQIAGIDLLTVHTDWEDWSRDWRAKTERNYTLLEFLSHAKGLGCHDKHDHVYAFLGHPLFQRKDGSGPWLIPDYANKTVEDLFTELTERMILEVGLHVLSAVEHDEREMPGGSKILTVDEVVPSWVVRWDMDVIWNSMGYYPDFYYRTCGGDTRVLAEEPKNGVLKVQAMLVDTVAATYQFSKEAKGWETTDAQTFPQHNKSQNDVLGQIWRDINDEKTPCRYSSTLRIDAMSLTLGAGLRNYISAEEDIEQYRANFAAFWELRHSITSRDPMPPRTRQPFVKGSANDFLLDMNLSCKGRTFFITQEGYYGLGPWIMKPGDECHIIEGGRVPFVLRQVANGVIKLLGESYVQGIMHGQIHGKLRFLFLSSILDEAWEDRTLLQSITYGIAPLSAGFSKDEAISARLFEFSSNAREAVKLNLDTAEHSGLHSCW